jgi:hypothetical protein
MLRCTQHDTRHNLLKAAPVIKHFHFYVRKRSQRSWQLKVEASQVLALRHLEVRLPLLKPPEVPWPPKLDLDGSGLLTLFNVTLNQNAPDESPARAFFRFSV